MRAIRHLILLSIFTQVLGFNGAAWSATSLDDELNDLTPKYSMHVDGRTSIYGAFNNNECEISLRESYVSVSGEIEEELRAVITLNLSHIVSTGELEFNPDFSISEFVKEAYIELREFKGKPYAFIIGKRPITFGQNVEQMPFFERNPLSSKLQIDEVFGFTVELTEGLLGALDSIEFSVYESGTSDLEITGFGSYAFRGTKLLSKQYLLTLGYSSEIQEGQEERTKRFNIGLIFKSENGKLIGWAEGIIFSHDPQSPNSNFALHAGLSYIFSPKLRFVIETNIIQNELYQIGLGLRASITKKLELGLESRVTLFQNNELEYFNGIVLTHVFDYSTLPPEEDLLLEDEDDL